MRKRDPVVPETALFQIAVRPFGRTKDDLNYWWSIGITENRIPLFGPML